MKLVYKRLSFSCDRILLRQYHATRPCVYKPDLHGRRFGNCLFPFFALFVAQGLWVSACRQLTTHVGATLSLSTLDTVLSDNCAKIEPSCKIVCGLGLCSGLLHTPPECGDVQTPHASHGWDRALACADPASLLGCRSGTAGQVMTMTSVKVGWKAARLEDQALCRWCGRGSMMIDRPSLTHPGGRESGVHMLLHIHRARRS